MLVRPARNRSRGAILRAVGVLSIALGAALPGRLIAQEAQQQPSDAPKTHTVKRGDTLWDLAHSYLGDPFLWPEIYRLNTDVIEDPHWIYPGEVLKLPGAKEKVIAVTPPVDTTPKIATPVVTPAPVDTAPKSLTQARLTAVRTNEFIAAPWVDEQGGPKGSGYIVESAEIPGIASADRSRMKLYDRVFVAAPSSDHAASGRALYLTYRLGPFIEEFGQIVIPTGIIEVARAGQPGEAAVGRVVKMFGEVLQGQRMIPLDSSAALATGRPNPVSDGTRGHVRWINNQPVLPSLQNYVALDLSGRDVTTGDQIELYQPRQGPNESRDITLPEIYIGRAQVLRVTSYGASAIIIAQEQPKIQEGTAVRVAAKMP